MHPRPERDAQASTPRRVIGTTPLVEVVRWARGVLATANAFDLDVPDPDTEVRATGGAQRPDVVPVHTWRAWVDLAELLGCRCHTPERIGPDLVRVRFSRLDPEAAWHGAVSDDGRYHPDAPFAAVRKLEHPGFLVPLLDALERVRPPDGGRVLVLGCHRGDEIAALGWLDTPPTGLDVVGVDRSAGALAQARLRFPQARFVAADVHELPIELGRFHLVIVIDVFQSPRVDDKAVLRRIVQHHLQPDAGLLIGLPNSRFRGDEVVWGARTRNYRASDLSLLVRDLAAYRRYLQQHGFVTHVGGRYDLLLGAWRRGGGTDASV